VRRAGRTAAERVRGEHVRSRDPGRAEHRVQLRDDVGGRARLGHRGAPLGQRVALEGGADRPGPVVGADPVVTGECDRDRGPDGGRLDDLVDAPRVAGVVIAGDQHDGVPAGSVRAVALQPDSAPPDVDGPGEVAGRPARRWWGRLAGCRADAGRQHDGEDRDDDAPQPPMSHRTPSGGEHEGSRIGHAPKSRGDPADGCPVVTARVRPPGDDRGATSPTAASSSYGQADGPS
jgi:hypothetical protein